MKGLGEVHGIQIFISSEWSIQMLPNWKLAITGMDVQNDIYIYIYIYKIILFIYKNGTPPTLTHSCHV